MQSVVVGLYFPGHLGVLNGAQPGVLLSQNQEQDDLRSQAASTHQLNINLPRYLTIFYSKVCFLSYEELFLPSQS